MDEIQETKTGVVVRLPTNGPSVKVAGMVDRLVAGLARHWLAAFNTILALFVGLPFLAPVLMHLGDTTGCAACTRVGGLIYAVYSPTCHQLPERSFFLFGPQSDYSVSELEGLGVLPHDLSIFQRQLLRFAGAPQIGYKVAICQRDVGIYAALLLSGLLFALLRSHLRRADGSLPKLPIWLYALCLVPLVIDGGLQLIGWRESSWPLRVLTGGLFGAATVWLAYPYVDEAMADVMRSSSGSHRTPMERHPQTGQNQGVEV